MEKIKRFIDIAVPVQTCNLRCPYCYIAQEDKFLAALPYFMYDAKTMGKALSKERLGGVCHFNLCGGGETLLPPQMTEILYELLAQGHYLAVVTNGTVPYTSFLCHLYKEWSRHLGSAQQKKSSLHLAYDEHCSRTHRTCLTDAVLYSEKRT